MVRCCSIIVGVIRMTYRFFICQTCGIHGNIKSPVIRMEDGTTLCRKCNFQLALDRIPDRDVYPLGPPLPVETMRLDALGIMADCMRIRLQ